MSGITLSSEQLEKLNNGESIEVNSVPDPIDGVKTIHPPCDEFGHEWYNLNISRDAPDDFIYVKQRCSKCGDIKVLKVPLAAATETDKERI